MHPRRSPIAWLILLILFAAVPLEAAAARRGWTKLELSHASGGTASLPPGLLAKSGAELIADYGTYAIVYAPKGALQALEAQAAQENFRVRERDDLDVLHFPGGDVDAREGITGVAPQKLTRAYPAGRPGLFVVQFTAAARKEWLAGLQAAGWTISRYVPNNAYLVIGRPELAADTRPLPYVQFVDFYHPYQKASWLQRDGTSRNLVFELPSGAASEVAVEAIRASSERAIQVHRGLLDTLVYARMTAAAAEELLRHELILSAGVEPDGELADGRQVLSLTPLLNANQSAPSSPSANYWNWVLSVCPECATMPATTWKIGVADSGLDNGQQAFGHPDLNGRKFFGAVGYGDGTNGHDPQCGSLLICDAHRHGTLVSGMAAGNNGTNAFDLAGYPRGLGGAPTAGIFMTKILSTSFGINPNNGALHRWTADAANNGVTVQNHSWQNNASAGQYTVLSRWFDIAARDADDAQTANRFPLLMTVASGNDTSGAGLATSPVGMAKNVLTVGGLENFRPEANNLNCTNTQGDSFRNIMKISRIGTNLAGYIKPDVMAPASLIVSAQTSIYWPTDPLPASQNYCLYNYEGDFRYSGASGTSFAAPMGAAASIIVKRYLGATPAATSPALVRATLVAGARSVRGGEDRTELTTVPIGPVPSQQQGFGRLTLEDILNGVQKPVVFDQAVARTFTAPGQTFCTRLRVRDASKPVKIALVWTDTPALAGATNPLVSDLDLEVRRFSLPTRLHVGNSLAVATEANGEESIAHVTGGSLPYDTVNNIEYFRSFLNASEEFNITVKARTINGDTDGNLANFEQDFALVILNADLISSGSCDTPPVASFTIACTDLTCTADGSASTDDFGIANYRYDWGDGVLTNGGAIQSHTYASGGTRTVTLTVFDTINQTGSTTRQAPACAPLSITAQPQSTSVVPGGSAALSVTATGTSLTYQWYRGISPDTSNPIPGATGPTFNTGALTQTTSYWVRVTRNCNGTSFVNSQTATVTVACTAAPTITTHPVSRTQPANTPVTLSVVATQGQFYQWYVGASGNTANPIAGATSSSVTVSPSVTTSYWVRVSNGCGSADSNAAVITICNPPAISQQPQSQTIPAGQAATVSVVASGDPTLTYQWYEGVSGNTANPIPGATGAQYTTPALFAAKQYWVRVTNPCGFVNSATATVNVTCNREPIITAQPQGGPINQGGSRTLSVSVQPDGPVSYQWYVGTSGNTASPIAGATASSVTVSPSSTTNYWVRVTNSCGFTNSATATVTVCIAPSIMQHPQSVTITAGSSTTLTVVAGGSGPFTYQWYIGASGNTASPIAGATGSSVVVAPTVTTSYWVRVTSTCNGSASVNSNAATVTVVPPVITRRQAAFATVNSQISITANWTTPTQAGNLLVAVISSDKHDSDTWNWTPPAGWVLATTYELNHVKSSIYYLPNNAGGRTSETFTINVARYRDQILQLVEYSGIALSNPLDRTAFNGDHSNDGFVDTGYTANTVQPKELVITSLTVGAQTEFWSPSGGFTEVSDRFISWNLTNAVHEKITTVAGSYGHYASVGSTEQWVGLVATFKSANPN